MGPGRWRKYRTHRYDEDLTQEQRERVERLESIGYLTGSEEARDVVSVTAYDKDKTQPGYNFFTSGHGPEAVLVDMEGKVIHRWRKTFDEIWPDYPISVEGRGNTEYWRRAHLFPNGDVIAMHEGLGLLKLDKDSNVLWAHPYRVHHDFDFRPNGDILVLTREAHIVPRINEKTPIMEDFITLLDPEGNEKGSMSLLECFEKSGPEHSWTEAARVFWEKEKTRKTAWFQADIFHTNSLEIIDRPAQGRGYRFNPGDVLLSFCHLDMIAVVELVEGTVTWSMTGRSALQHDPHLLPDDSIVFFDNHWKPLNSRATAIDPATGVVQWSFSGTEGDTLYSTSCGTVDPLANGSFLITESDQGRALEVTPEGEVVWEFYNPYRAGPNQEYIATLFEVQRIELDYPEFLD